jgi:Flp pilus assembly protein TadG
VMRRRKNHERGAAAVEFALVSLVLITLVGVVFQFAIYLWAFQAAANGAREGARAWAVNPCGTGQKAKVLQAVGTAARPTPTLATDIATPRFLDPTSGAVTAERKPGVTVEVTVKMQARQLGFNLVPGWDYNRTIIKTATARVEDTKDCP